MDELVNEFGSLPAYGVVGANMYVRRLWEVCYAAWL